MVPVSQLLALSYAQQLAALADGMAEQWQWPSPDSAFALHVFRTAGLALPLNGGTPVLPDSYRRRLDQGPVLATAGYLLASCPSDPDLQAAWAAGLARLTTRQAFPRDRESFFYRPLELLGLRLGLAASTAAEAEHRRWLLGVLDQGADLLRDAGVWAQVLAAYGAHALGINWRPPHFPHPNERALDELGLFVWLHLTCPGLLEPPGENERRRADQEELLRRAALAPLPQLDVSRSAVLHVALTTVIERFIRSSTERYWQLERDGRDAVELVRTLCARFHLFALQIQKRHGKRSTIGFDDEYDVQDVLHALLKLHFDDVRAEEWTPSYAGNASRTDILLKREQVVIETKVTRTKSRTLDQKEIANQLIIDARRYQAHPDCRTLVCFVYDPSHICHNVAALKSDLASDWPPLRVVVIVAPTGA